MISLHRTCAAKSCLIDRTTFSIDAQKRANYGKFVLVKIAISVPAIRVSLCSQIIDRLLAASELASACSRIKAGQGIQQFKAYNSLYRWVQHEANWKNKGKVDARKRLDRGRVLALRDVLRCR